MTFFYKMLTYKKRKGGVDTDVIERISAIMKLANGIQDHEVYIQLGELRQEAFEQGNKLREIQEENRILKEKLKDEGKKTLENECYFFDGDGPFCIHCHDLDKKKIRMVTKDNGWGKIFNVCPECGLEVLKEKYPLEMP